MKSTPSSNISSGGGDGVVEGKTSDDMVCCVDKLRPRFNQVKDFFSSFLAETAETKTKKRN